MIESLNMMNPLWLSSKFYKGVVLLQSKTIEMDGIGRVLLERSKRARRLNISINYPAASGRGIRRVTIGNLHAVYDTPFLGF